MYSLYCTIVLPFLPTLLSAHPRFQYCLPARERHASDYFPAVFFGPLFFYSWRLTVPFPLWGSNILSFVMYISPPLCIISDKRGPGAKMYLQENQKWAHFPSRMTWDDPERSAFDHQPLEHHQKSWISKETCFCCSRKHFRRVYCHLNIKVCFSQNENFDIFLFVSRLFMGRF